MIVSLPKNKFERLSRNFIYIIILPRLKAFLYQYIPNKKMISYLQDIGCEYTTKEIIDEFLSNLKCKEIEDYFDLYLDNQLIFKDTKWTIDSLIKLMNYGNIEIRGTHLIDKAIKYIQSNISTWLYLYSSYNL